MSNTLAAVRFVDGSVYFTAFQGTGSSVNPVLRDNIEDVRKDPFPEPEWDEWVASASENDIPSDFYAAQDLVVFENEETVEIYTPYAGGEYWTGAASRSAMRITKNRSSEYSEECTPNWAEALKSELERL